MWQIKTSVRFYSYVWFKIMYVMERLASVPVLIKRYFDPIFKIYYNLLNHNENASS